ncbi:DNA repair recO domain protein [Mycobacteroides abscessus subsp. bolletii 1513]|uniref:DNA repair recO domain protein n=1 Tax=Mycobacteroides abscessus subsp. bolletii 1513 TaxID=1299321 RepID=X8DVN3_9MYCO|nr:DNA repair recO domain protein [Mycobacteroides abscessus subsp. bolletii 1513]
MSVACVPDATANAPRSIRWPGCAGSAARHRWPPSRRHAGPPSTPAHPAAGSPRPRDDSAHTRCRPRPHGRRGAGPGWRTARIRRWRAPIRQCSWRATGMRRE